MSNTKHIFPNLTILPHYFNKSLVSARIAIYVLIGSIIVVGNILCLVVFLRTKALRRRSFYLLINLSIADLMVGSSTVLIWIHDLLILQEKRSRDLLPYGFILQYLPQMCSLFIMATVAIERFWAVGYPIKHRQAGKLPYAAFISIPWLLSSLLTVLYLTSSTRFDLVSLHVFNYMDIALSQLTLLTIVLSYCALICKIKRTSSNATIRNNRNVIKERKLALTLFVVTLASLITFYPVNIYFMLRTVHGHQFAVSDNLFLFLIAIACCNSGINIFVYMLRISEFKREICRIFLRRRRHNHRVSCSTIRRDRMPSNINSSETNH